MKLLFIVFLLFNEVWTAPAKMAFTLAEPDEVVKTENPKGLAKLFQDLSESSYVKDFMSLLSVMGEAAAKNSPSSGQGVPLPVARGVRTQTNSRRIPMNDSPQAAAFQHSLSLDDSPQTEKKSISKEEWASTLFGERGVLTAVFQMMDQQRKAQNLQSDNAASTTFNGKKLDLKDIFDALLMGSKKSELGDPGQQQELPEFLGICNRLSCGDIYKAIDKFRKSDFFSNFQTALGLVQDPNGWETLGKLMSNPELIAQFTGGSGMEQIFGSALGQAKKESSKSQTKNSRLLPEDGDFGIDFSEDGEEKSGKKPQIDFSVDGKPETSDYYEEVSKGTNIGQDYDDTEEAKVDVALPSPKELLSKIPMAKGVTPATAEILLNKPLEPGMPELSLSIDEAVEEQEKAVDALPPPALTKSAGASGHRPVQILTTSRRTTTTRTSTTSRAPSKARTTRWIPTTTTPKTTTKNYRKDSDYYAMYYDEQAH